jgi:hypothetical protein
MDERMTLIRILNKVRYGFRTDSIRILNMVPLPSIRIPYRYGTSPDTDSVHLYRFTNAFLSIGMFFQSVKPREAQK